MHQLRAHLFLSLKLLTEDEGPIDLGAPTTRSIFAFLLLHRETPSDRRRMAFTFWPEATESAARRNLRQYLYRLRRALAPIDPQGSLLLSDGSQVQLNPRADIWVDAEAFERCLEAEASLQLRKRAIALYRGDLLEDIYEDWCTERRSRLRRSYLETLDAISEQLHLRGSTAEALEYAKRWVDAEPYAEAAHRRVMTLYTHAGERAQALQHYRALASQLQTELGTEPLPETQSLRAAIEAGILPDAQVGGPAQIALPKPQAASTIPLFGRASELAQLQQVLIDAQEGSGGFVLITGDAGIGKTRLVQEHIDGKIEPLTLQKDCHELESLVPYGALRPLVVSALKQVPHASFDPPPTWVRQLERLLPPVPSGGERSLPWESATEELVGLSGAFTSLLMTLSAKHGLTPAHLILDDLHWADWQTWELLGHLANQARSLPMVIIGLCRLEDLPAGRDAIIRKLERNDLLSHLPLQPLATEEAVALASHVLNERQPDTLLLQRLLHETGGNPLFIIETLRALKESDRQPTLPIGAGGQPVIQPPLSLRRVIEARLDRLRPLSQDLLACAAVIGHTFTLPVLEEISRATPTQIVDSIEEWIQRGLVREIDDAHQFGHALIREVSLARLSVARRQVLHREVAEVLERVYPPIEVAKLAHYFARSDQPLRALPYFTRAGEQALRLRSYQEAHLFGSRALNFVGRLPGPSQLSQRVELNIQLAQAFAFTGNYSRALEILTETERLASRLDDPPALAKVLHRLSQVFWLSGRPIVAGDYARQALRLAEELGDLPLTWAALRMVGRVSIAQSAFDDAIAHLRRYRRYGDADEPPPNMPIVLGYLGIAYARVGAWSAAFEAARRGVALAESTSSTATVDFARMQLAFLHGEQEDWEGCRRLLDQATTQQERLKAFSPYGFMYSALRARAHARLDDPQKGAADLRAVLDAAERSGYRVFHYLPRLFLAEALLQSRQLEQAAQEARRAFADATHSGNRWAGGVTLRLLAEIETRRPTPDWAQAERHLIRSMHVLRQVRARPDLARTFFSMRRLYDRAGQIAWAVDCHLRATAIFEDLGMREELLQAQGHPLPSQRHAVVIPGLQLRGPNVPVHELASHPDP